MDRILRRLGSTLGVLVLTMGSAGAANVRADSLLAIDQNRRTVIERVVGEWGEALVKSNAGIDAEQLRELLSAMRADQLLAASLAGSLEGLRNVVATAIVAESAVKPSLLQAKALGDPTADLVYTPVVPCRLFDTRPSQGGIGMLVPNVIRTYSATVPVAQQGGPGGCTAPAGTAVAMIQISTIAPPALGLLQGGAHGTGPFPNALILYQPGDQYGASIPMPVLTANGQFDLVAQFNGTHVAGDLLGYFRNAFAATGVLGTTSNTALELRANGSRVMRYEPNAISPNVIGGSPANNVTAGVRGATVAGGGVPAGNTDPDFGGEAPNRVTDAYGTVGGGYANRAGDDAGTTVDQSFATVGGGFRNTASGFLSTVGGGNSNTASGTQSTVGGGLGNAASGFLSTVGGGESNVASGDSDTVGGGALNTASGNFSTVAGGSGNTASGTQSTVGGGFGNTASGHHSWAGGTFAKTQTSGGTPVVHHGAFVWGDSNVFNFHSSADNEFAARATGGVRFVTAVDGIGNPTRTTRINPNAELEFGSQTRQMLNLWSTEYAIGAQAFTLYTRTNTHLAWFRGGVHSDAIYDPGSGGEVLMSVSSTPGVGSGTTHTGILRAAQFTVTSDREAKQDFAAVDTQAILHRVVATPVTTWAYRSEPQTRHIGMTGQDFRAAFGVGDSDRSISTVDADGVALAAIQGLNAKLEAKVAEQSREIAALRRAVDDLLARSR